MVAYLDWNATTPRHAQVVEAMARAEQEGWANPSSVHQAGRSARRLQEATREQLGILLERSPRDIVFTGGGTESNHLALSGARLLVTSRIEHPSILAQAQQMAESGTQVLYADVDLSGRIVPHSVEQALKEALGDPQGEPDPGSRTSGGVSNRNTPLIAVMAANHETGVIQPLEEISGIVRRFGARLHVDAVQWIGKAPLSALRCADSLSISAHKFRGPKGVGVLAFDCGWIPTPLGRGGAQERGLRPGTVDAVSLAGLGAALGRLDESVAAYGRASRLRQRLLEHMQQQARVQLEVHGANVPSLGHVLNFRAAGWKGDELVAALDLEGVCVSSGSACSAGTSEASPVITAMLGKEAAGGAVRISLGEETSANELQLLVSALAKMGILNNVPIFGLTDST
jgi:cysteine desulfurase